MQQSEPQSEIPSSTAPTGEPDARSAARQRQRLRQARFWAAVPVVLLVGMVVGLGGMAFVAIDDPSFAIEEDYYRKAVAWDEAASQRAENTRLGWNMSLELEVTPGGVKLNVALTGRDGTPIEGATVDVKAFHNARAGTILQAPLHPEGPRYVGYLPMRRPGLWEFRFLVVHGSDRFTSVLRHDAPEV